MTTAYQRDKDALGVRMVGYVRCGRPHFDTIEMIEKVFREQSFMHYRHMDFSKLAELVSTEPKLRMAKVTFNPQSPGAPLGDVLASALSQVVVEEFEPLASTLSFEFWECRVVGLLARYCEVARHILRANIGGHTWWASDLENTCERLVPVLEGHCAPDLDVLVATVADAAHALDRAIGSSEVSWMMLNDVGVDRPLSRRVANALENLKRLASDDAGRFASMALGELTALDEASDRADWLVELRRKALPANAEDLRRRRPLRSA
jgi:hypothetical protein